MGDVLVDMICECLFEEVVYGVDFLVCMFDELGVFYMIIFDGWLYDLEKCSVCVYWDVIGIKLM